MDHLLPLGLGLLLENKEGRRRWVSASRAAADRHDGRAQCDRPGGTMGRGRTRELQNKTGCVALNGNGPTAYKGFQLDSGLGLPHLPVGAADGTSRGAAEEGAIPESPSCTNTLTS